MFKSINKDSIHEQKFGECQIGELYMVEKNIAKCVEINKACPLGYEPNFVYNNSINCRLK
jgi:hypothetical protein